MGITTNPYSTILIIGSLIVVGSAIFAWQRGTYPTRRYLALTNIAIAVYVFGYGMELNQQDIAGALFWIKFEYIGITFIPVAVLALMLVFTGRQKWLNTLLFVSSVPIITIALAYTNEYHEWIWKDLEMIYSHGLSVLDFTGGVWYWVFVIFLYTCITISIIMLVSIYKKLSPFFQKQSILLFAAIFLPALFSFLYHIVVAVNLPIPKINWQAFAFILTSILMTTGMINFHLFDLSPIAYSAIFDNMTDLVVVLDEQNRVTDYNPAAAELLGWAREDVTGTHVRKHLEGSLKTFYEQHEYTQHARAEVHLGDNYFDTSLTAFGEKPDTSNGRLLVMHDITENVFDNQQIRLQATAMEAVDNAIMITDTEGTIIWGNASLTKLTGYSVEELIGEQPRKFKSGNQGQEFYQQMWGKILQGEPWRGQLTNRHKEGHLYIQEVVITPVLDHEGNIHRFVSIMQDISERVEEEKKLHYLATHDSLTQLPNRMLLHNLLLHAVLHAERAHTKVGILFIDINKFKNINDQYGHDYGDKVLQEVAGNLKRSIRQSDTISRWGGDEFVIVLENLRSKANIFSVIQKISQNNAFQILLDGHQIEVQLSIGIAVYPDDGMEIDSLFNLADQAMYAAKNDTEKSYAFHQLPEMEEAFLDDLPEDC